MITIIILTYDSNTRLVTQQAKYYKQFFDVRLIILDAGDSNLFSFLRYHNVYYLHCPGAPLFQRLKLASELIADGDIVISLNDDEFYLYTALRQAAAILHSSQDSFVSGIPYTFFQYRDRLVLQEWQPPFASHREFSNNMPSPINRVKELAASYLPVYYHSLMHGSAWKLIHSLSMDLRYAHEDYMYVKELHTCLMAAISGKHKLLQLPMLLRNADPQKSFTSWHSFFFSSQYRLKSLLLTKETIRLSGKICQEQDLKRTIIEYYIHMAEMSRLLEADNSFYLRYCTSIMPITIFKDYQLQLSNKVWLDTETMKDLMLILDSL